MKKILIYALLLFLFSCQEENPSTVPENIIPKEKMVLALTDIHIAEAEANLRALPYLSAGQSDSSSCKKINFQKIFEKHHITKEQYETSLSFYIDRPKLLNEIYKEVLNELSKMQSPPTEHGVPQSRTSMPTPPKDPDGTSSGSISNKGK